jgi:hypothetical protein
MWNQKLLKAFSRKKLPLSTNPLLRSRISVIPCIHLSDYVDSATLQDSEPAAATEEIPTEAIPVEETPAPDHTEAGTTEEISPEEQPIEPEATAQEEESGNFRNIHS